MESADKLCIEIIAAATMPIAVIAVIAHRIWLGMGLGVRAIQFVALAFVVPLILILALEGVLERSAVGALVGALVGYLFANIGNFDERKAGRSDAKGLKGQRRPADDVPTPSA